MHKLNGRSLIGGNIVTHLDHIKDAQETKTTHFKSSKLWQAVQNNILSWDPDDCVLLKREKDPLHRKSGMTLVDVFSRDSGKILQFDVKLTYVADEGHGREYTKQYTIYVPSELELDFSRVHFQAWLQGERVKLEQQDRAEAITHLQRLVSLYPIDTQKLLTATKTEAKAVAEKSLKRRRK